MLPLRAGLLVTVGVLVSCTIACVGPALYARLHRSAAVPGPAIDDRDRDGIVDGMDLCPDAAEDKDGFEDEDGCPDPDNDRDQIVDALDRCPNEPETYNGFEDEDGCPDRARVIIHKSHDLVFDAVYFRRGSATISAMSAPIIDSMVATLRANLWLRKIEVRGRRSRHEPVGLDELRAHAVVDAFIAGGIAADRLVVSAAGATPRFANMPLHATAAYMRVVDFEVREATTPED